MAYFYLQREGAVVRVPKEGPKRKRAIWKNIYRNYEKWACLIEAEGPEKAVLEIDGEDVYFYDLMAGYDKLPKRQKEAFDLHVLLGMSEGEAAKIMFPGSRWSTPVQQYAKTALVRMIAAYERVQTGEERRERIEALRKKAERHKEKIRRARERDERDRRNAEGFKHRGSESSAESRPEEETEGFIQSTRNSLFD